MVVYVLRIVAFSARRRYKIKYYIFCAIVDVVFSTFTDREIQIYSNPTIDAYHSWLNGKLSRTKDPRVRQRLVHDIQPLGETGGSVAWLGNRRKADKVVLFLHGGGFIAPALRGHFEWCWNTYIEAGREAGIEVAVGCLQYTLLNGGRFPVPLTQAVEALSGILDSGVSPSDVYLGGDSAGGNLSVQVLGHLLHPCPGLRRLDLAGVPLGGVFLVSPWLSNNVASDSFARNDGHDMISTGAMDKLGAAMYGKALLDTYKTQVAVGNYSAANAYMTPLDTVETWLDGIERTTESVYVTVGKNEIMYDHGVGLVRLLRRRNAPCRIRLDEADREAHDFILVENIFRQPGDATARMKAWFKEEITEGGAS